jgi:hypothetical protein
MAGEAAMFAGKRTEEQYFLTGNDTCIAQGFHARSSASRVLARRMRCSHITAGEARMLHMLLLALLTTGVATLTFALLALASLLGFATSGGRR